LAAEGDLDPLQACTLPFSLQTVAFFFPVLFLSIRKGLTQYFSTTAVYYSMSYFPVQTALKLRALVGEIISKLISGDIDVRSQTFPILNSFPWSKISHIE
jgi:hypothetical protein